MGLTEWEQDQARILAICTRLTDDGVVEPLADRPDDERAWNGWELASLVEGNFGQQIDVATLNDDQRVLWELRANWDHRPLRRPHGEYRLPHWLLEDGVRVGTISFATMFRAMSLLDVSSLFARATDGPTARSASRPQGGAAHALCGRPADAWRGSPWQAISVARISP